MVLCFAYCIEYSHIFTGSIERSENRRYLVYTEADFEVFRTAGATGYTDAGEN